MSNVVLCLILKPFVLGFPDAVITSNELLVLQNSVAYRFNGSIQLS